MSTVSAPGKVVLWGEYAVLVGAPAGVLALNSEARVSLTPSADANWHFSSEGLPSTPSKTAAEALPNSPQSTFVALTLKHWGYEQLAACGPPLRIHTDSAAFYANGQKLGLGSSAAVCTATYYALCDLTDRRATVEEALALHRQWQGGKGSGLDVATVWQGGYVHFQNGQARRATLPDGLHWQVIYSGTSASTRDHIGHFEQWRQQGDTPALTDLATLSHALCEDGLTLTRLSDYHKALMALDQAAILNIFTQEHARLGKLAAASGVLYKPCGAGGGDIGIAFADDPEGLANFRQQAAADGFLPLDLEMATHGVAFQHRQ